ncbi:hypothetical protein PINS_up000540 [Pythium insidiosum]|nr:hypothetical protein PINS_up000540 [Pythium insidiosum]
MDKALLNRATSKEDTPTPGYLYGEIARMTQHSYDTCSKVQEFLISRVKNKHHNIKYKALQVIKHVCREGRVDFKREMQKHIPTIKECLQFRGPPDPLKGDEYYRRVRDAAKECLDAIYDTDNTPGLGGMGMSARIQGVGNPADQANSGSGWGARLPWGRSSTNNDAPPSNIGNLPSYSAPGGGYGGPPYPGDGGGYGGPNPGYGGPNPGYDGPNPGYGGPNPGYGGPQQYGQPPAPYSDNPSYGGPPNAGGPGGFGGPPPMNDQKISGFGNPMYQDPRDEKAGFFKGLKDRAASRFTKTDSKPNISGAPPGYGNTPDGWTLATNRGPTSGSYGLTTGSYNPDEPYRPGGSYHPNATSYPSTDAHQHAMSQLKAKAYDGDRKKGRVGGAWTAEAAAPPAPAPRENRAPSYSNDNRSRASSRGGDFGGYDQGRDERAFSASQGPPAPVPMAPPRATGQTSGAQSDGTYERNLVTALCAPGGMRAIPPKDKLDAFIKSALTLDAEIVGPILEDCLADAQWTVVSKALATIDALIKSSGCEDFVDYFTENYSEIESCTASDKAAVRDRAIKIMSALGHSSGAPAQSRASRQSSAPRASKSSARSSEPDLLGDFSDPAPSNGGGDLFSWTPNTVSCTSRPNSCRHQQCYRYVWRLESSVDSRHAVQRRSTAQG